MFQKMYNDCPNVKIYCQLYNAVIGVRIYKMKFVNQTMMIIHGHRNFLLYTHGGNEKKN